MGNVKGKKIAKAKRDTDRISLSVHCPKCRRRMVLRQGPVNYFYGCSGFPDECRHTLTLLQAQGLHKHIEKKKCAHKGKAAKRAAKKRIDLRAAAHKAAADLKVHRNERKRQEVPSRSPVPANFDLLLEEIGKDSETERELTGRPGKRIAITGQ